MNNDIPEPLRSLKHFLSLGDIEPPQVQALIDFSIRRKGQFKRGELEPVLRGKVLAMIFQKASLRTRLGFEAAMAQLGGHAVNLEDHQVGLTRREDVKDVARVVSSMCDGIMARVHAHHLVVELAANSPVPVINGLSDWLHPCQALSDAITIQEHFGDLAGRKLAFIGDGNNVARSLLNLCLKMRMSFTIAAPAGYQLEDGVIQPARAVAEKSGVAITVTSEPAKAAVDADVVYTDVWTSMGQEAEQAQREQVFGAYQVNAALLEHAKPTAVVLHCLPAHRNKEITDEVIDGPQSLVFAQAENRLHSQRALLEVLLRRRT